MPLSARQRHNAVIVVSQHGTGTMPHNGNEPAQQRRKLEQACHPLAVHDFHVLAQHSHPNYGSVRRHQWVINRFRDLID